MVVNTRWHHMVIEYSNHYIFNFAANFIAFKRSQDHIRRRKYERFKDVLTRQGRLGQAGR